MKQSEDITKLATALCAAQGEMGGAVKDAENPFFKSKYADLTSVIKAIKEPFLNHGLSYTQSPVSSENGVGVATRLLHTSGQWLEGEFVLPIVKQDPQSAGAAITYARRYSLQSMAGIPTADDDAEATQLRGAAPYTEIQKSEFDEFVDNNNNGLGLICFAATVGSDVMDSLNSSFGKGKISSGKETIRKLTREGWGVLKQSAAEIEESIRQGDSGRLLETVAELEPIERKLLAGLLEPSQIAAIKKVQELAA
jgi:hypothetical protein